MFVIYSIFDSKFQCQVWDTSWWAVSQVSPRGSQNNMGSCHSSWLSTWTSWSDPIAKDTTHLGWKIQNTKTELEVSSLVVRLYSTVRHKANCWGRPNNKSESIRGDSMNVFFSGWAAIHLWVCCLSLLTEVLPIKTESCNCLWIQS